MKNSRVDGRLTSPRAAVLDALMQQPDPVGIQALSRRLGRHHNTVREQLNWLVGRGLVRRYRVPGTGRGRPSWHYQAVGPKPGEGDHAEMAAELAWTLSEEGRAASADEARSRGRQWGRDRAQGPQDSAQDARAATVEVLDELGFEPITDDGINEVLLTRCPLLQAAHQFPAIVCSMHQGLVEGMLVAHGDTGDGVVLVPFGHAEGCPLRLLESPQE